MDLQTFKRLKRDYGKWSSWAVWNDDSPHDTNIITSKYKELNAHYVIVGLNVSQKLTIDWSNFHVGKNDSKLVQVFNNSAVRGAYMIDLFRLINSKSEEIDLYITDSRNTKSIHARIQCFQKELKDVGVTRKTTFILLGKQVQHYFPFFLHKELYFNRRVLIPHYSAYISGSKWLKTVKKLIGVEYNQRE